jgi:hypothetical protein
MTPTEQKVHKLIKRHSNNFFSLVQRYSDILENSTGCTVKIGRDHEGDACFYVIDACGDQWGDAWFDFQDLVLDTEEVLDGADREEFILVASELFFAA